MFVFFILITIISFSSIHFISPIPKSTKVDFHCNDGVADLKFCSKSLDHCASDFLIGNKDSNETANKEYEFDVSIRLFTFMSVDYK